MKIKLLSMIGFTLLILGGCGDNQDENIEASQGTDVGEIKELVHEYSTDNVPGEVASITSHELIVTENDGNKVTYDLPEDEFFVSIAPYIDETHP